MSGSGDNTRSLLPKRCQLKRRSVDSPSSVRWVDDAIAPVYNGKFPKISYSHVSFDALPDIEFDLSPAASPEADHLFELNSCFNGVDSPSNKRISQVDVCAEPPVSPTFSITSCNEIISPSVSSNNSSPSHSVNSNSVKRQKCPDVDQLFELCNDSQVPPFRDSLQLPRLPNSDKNGLATRLSKLLKQTYSKRFIWLHKCMQNDSDSHNQYRDFRILACDVPSTVTFPGLLGFNVFTLPSESGTTISKLFLPVCGSNSTGRQPKCLLANVLGPGDVVRVYPPWSSCTGPNQMHFIFACFWAEKINRTAEVSIQLPVTATTAHIPLACSCLGTGSSCNRRYRCPEDQLNIGTGSEHIQDSILVLDFCRFWIMHKPRSALLALHSKYQYGLILLPGFGNEFSEVDTNPKWMVGSVYSVQSLLQLPSEQINFNIRRDVLKRCEELALHTFIQKISNFCSNSVRSERWDDAIPKQLCLWDGRTATFKLTQTAFISINSIVSPRRIDLCGTMLFEPFEGSLLKSMLLQDVQKLLAQNNSLPDELSPLNRLFFLLLDGDDGVTVCLCKSHALSPLDIFKQSGPTLNETFFPKRFSGARVFIRDAMALKSKAYIVVDEFTKMSFINKSTSIHETDVPSRIVTSSSDPITGKIGQLIRFSGTVVNVDTNRSHTWPVCAVCLSADLKHADDGQRGLKSPAIPPRFSCRRCLSLVTNPLQLLELEVHVRLNHGTSSAHALPNPVILNMSPNRMLKLLEATNTTTTSSKAFQFSHRGLLHKELKNILGVCIQRSTDCKQQPVIIELD